MKFLGLSEPHENRAQPSLAAAMIGAGVGFSAVMVAGYTIWAFKIMRESAAQYAAIAAIVVCLGGWVVGRAAVRRGAAWSFPACFALGFLVYAVLWSVAWFALRGKFRADLIGAIAGLAALTWIWQRAFGAARGFLVAFVVLLALHSAGYYLGEYLYATVRGTNGRLLWGAAHGLGFGAGLGFVLHRLQQPAATAAR